MHDNLILEYCSCANCSDGLLYSLVSLVVEHATFYLFSGYLTLSYYVIKRLDNYVSNLFLQSVSTD